MFYESVKRRAYTVQYSIRKWYTMGQKFKIEWARKTKDKMW